jgi:hypothetical protein
LLDVRDMQTFKLLWPATILIAGCLEPRLDDGAGSIAKTDKPAAARPSLIVVPAPDSDGDGFSTPSDCDDTDPDVHPYAREVANGVDDNCDGRIDEPVLAYSATRPPEGNSYAELATIDLRISDAATIAYLNANPYVRFALTYEALEQASGAAVTTPARAAMITPSTWSSGVPGPNLLRLNPNNPLNGFTPRTVYRLTIQLFDFTAVTPIGPASDWFYMVTGGTAAMPSDTLNWARVDMVLRALDQYGPSQTGAIGPNGRVDPDGTRFVSSLHPAYNPGDELTGWCDWFYHYLGAVVTDGLDGSIAANPVVDGGNTFWKDTMNPDNVPNAFRDPLDDGCGSEIGDVDGNGIAGEVIDHGCQSYTAAQVRLDRDDNQFYSNISTNIYYDAVKSLASNQAMGNYQAMDSHAGMFLAFDPNGDGSFDGAGTAGTVWSIEGNVGDRVKIMHRTAADPIINGFGKLTLAMFSP